MRGQRESFSVLVQCGARGEDYRGCPREEWNAEPGKIKTAGPFAAALGIGNYSGVSRLSEAVYAHARNHARLRAHGIPRFFRIHSRGGGIFWWLPADRRIVHADCGIAGGGGNGGGTGEGAWTVVESGESGQLSISAG